MRLLDVETLRLVDFPDKQALPPYAILSHVWGIEEVTFRDIQDLPRARTMQGFRKIEGCCAVALANGYLFAWIDTCCIDKDSSAELSEAINSMYEWYMLAAVCYAFLADVPPSSTSTLSTDHVQHLRDSKWFTRGWTLQELLAPRKLEFLASDWTTLGARDALMGLVSEITGIDADVLVGRRSVMQVSVARRMSWAARRKTTRVEDRAYSLMGIFGIYMTTIYGEGENAFVRLQLEIIRQIPDHSVFVWGRTEEYETLLERTCSNGFYAMPPWDLLGGILASSPAAFEDSGDVEPVPWHTLLKAVLPPGQWVGPAMPASSQNPLGIQATLPLARCSTHFYRVRISKYQYGRALYSIPRHYICILPCRRRDNTDYLLALLLQGNPRTESMSVGWGIDEAGMARCVQFPVNHHLRHCVGKFTDIAVKHVAIQLRTLTLRSLHTHPAAFAASRLTESLDAGAPDMVNAVAGGPADTHAVQDGGDRHGGASNATDEAIIQSALPEKHHPRWWRRLSHFFRDGLVGVGQNKQP